MFDQTPTGKKWHELSIWRLSLMMPTQDLFLAS